MVKKLDKAKARAKRHQRVRNKINGTADCPRLNVFRSSKHIYAQVIDDVNGVTLCSASSMSKDFEGNGGNKEGTLTVYSQRLDYKYFGCAIYDMCRSQLKPNGDYSSSSEYVCEIWLMK